MKFTQIYLVNWKHSALHIWCCVSCYRSYMRGAQGPTVVHCSPGTGRTGTVIAIDLCIRDFETQRSVDIPRTVYSLRRSRAGAVQTKDQYAFIYQVSIDPICHCVDLRQYCIGDARVCLVLRESWPHLAYLSRIQNLYSHFFQRLFLFLHHYQWELLTLEKSSSF